MSTYNDKDVKTNLLKSTFLCHPDHMQVMVKILKFHLLRSWNDHRLLTTIAAGAVPAAAVSR